MSDSSHSSNRSSRDSPDFEAPLPLAATIKEPTKRGRFQVRELADDEKKTNRENDGMPATSNVITLASVRVEDRATGEIKDHIMEGGKLLPSPGPPGFVTAGGLIRKTITESMPNMASSWPRTTLYADKTGGASNSLGLHPGAGAGGHMGITGGISYLPGAAPAMAMQPPPHLSCNFQSAPTLGTAAVAYAAAIGGGGAGALAGLELPAGVSAAAVLTESGVDVQKQMGRFLVRQIGGSASSAPGTPTPAPELPDPSPAFGLVPESPKSAAAALQQQQQQSLPPMPFERSLSADSVGSAAAMVHPPLALALFEQNRLILDRLAALELSLMDSSGGGAIGSDRRRSQDGGLADMQVARGPLAQAAATGGWPMTSAVPFSSSMPPPPQQVAAAAAAAQRGTASPLGGPLVRGTGGSGAGGGGGSLGGRAEGGRLYAILEQLRVELEAQSAARRGTELELKVLREKNRSAEERLRAEAARAAAAEARLERAKARNRALGEDNAMLRQLMSDVGVAVPQPPTLVPPPVGSEPFEVGGGGLAAAAAFAEAYGHSGEALAVVPLPQGARSPPPHSAQVRHFSIPTLGSVPSAATSAAGATTQQPPSTQQQTHPAHMRRASAGAAPSQRWPPAPVFQAPTLDSIVTSKSFDAVEKPTSPPAKGDVKAAGGMAPRYPLHTNGNGGAAELSAAKGGGGGGGAAAAAAGGAKTPVAGAAVAPQSFGFAPPLPPDGVFVSGSSGGGGGGGGGALHHHRRSVTTSVIGVDTLPTGDLRQRSPYVSAAQPPSNEVHSAIMSAYNQRPAAPGASQMGPGGSAQQRGGAGGGPQQSQAK